MFKARRFANYAPFGVFSALLLALAVIARNPILRALYLVGAIACVVPLVRAWQLSVTVDDSGVTVQEIIHRCHYPWSEIVSAATVQLGRETRFSKPSHVALAIRTRDGKLRRFNNLSAPEVRRHAIDTIAEYINARCLPLDDT